jgi:hypothetical protein
MTAIEWLLANNNAFAAAIRSKLTTYQPKPNGGKK